MLLSEIFKRRINSMLGLAVRNTGKLIREKSKTENIRLGRLFTKKETAALMAAKLTLDKTRTSYTILDPGAGTGILAAALIERILRECPMCKTIFVSCYENNEIYLPMLKDNLERIRKKCRHDYGARLYVTVYEENYLTESKKHYTVTFRDTVEDKYDLIICNPPTELYERDSEEAISTGGVTQLKIGAPFLFARMTARHLEAGGEAAIILPTTVASAASLTPFRREMAEAVSITGVHLFVGRQKNKSRAIPLKKNLILTYGKCDAPDTLTITTSTDNGKAESICELPALDYSFVVSPQDGSLTLPKSVEDTKIVKYISAFPETLTSLGLKMSTGLVIDSKCEGLLFSEPTKGAVPLIRPATIESGMIEFPKPIKRQYIAAINPALIQKNKNMVIVKRIPAKSDERFLNCAIYMAAQLPAYRFISTHNKINFIDAKDKNTEIPARLAYGLFALLNSTIYDRYLSIVSKSKQINSKEMRALPLPPRNIIENIGMRLMALRQTSVKACDSIVNPTLHIIEK